MTKEELRIAKCRIEKYKEQIKMNDEDKESYQIAHDSIVLFLSDLGYFYDLDKKEFIYQEMESPYYATKKRK